VSDANCVELLVLADLHGVTALKRAASAHIKKNAALLTSFPQWKRRIIALSRQQKKIVQALVI
jgi:hypothetical protein